ncbi:MAG: 30S ribosomal protein S17 [Byssovorax sp.]|jgi:small subunit ribosomal protein S17
MASKKKEPMTAKPSAAKAAAKPAEAKAPAAAAPAPKAEPKPAAKPAAAAPAPKAESAVTESVATAHGFRRKLVGKVTSNKMDKTVTVEVIRNSPDPVYKKYVRARERYKAHDETNQYKIGDRVEIQEHRPISRDKRWLVTKLISRAVEE